MVTEATQNAFPSFCDMLWFMAEGDNIMPLEYGAFQLSEWSLGHLLGIGGEGWWINDEVMD